MDDVSINYLAKLDYIDLRNFCRTSKDNLKLYNNTMLRNIITLRSDIVLPSNVNIVNILNELDGKMNTLIDIHYFDFPRWINRDLFLIDFKKRLYYNFSDDLADKFDMSYIHHENSFDDELFEEDRTVIVNLSKYHMAFAFVSHEYIGYRYDDEIPVNESRLILSKELVDYIMSVISPQNYSYGYLTQIISNLLFIDR